MVLSQIEGDANENLSPTSSIHSWLQQTELPRKRKAVHSPLHASKRQRRIPLADLGKRPMQTSLRAQRAASKDEDAHTGGPRTPQRVARGRGDEERTTLESQGRAVLDDDLTPRAPSLPPPSSSDASSSRSQSPTKMAALKNMHRGLEYHLINYGDVQQNADHPLHVMIDFVRNMDDLLQGVGVIPEERRLECRSADPHDFRLEHLFDRNATTDRKALGSSPSMHEVMKIWKKSVKFETDQEPEAAWNCGVHYPVADLAGELSAYSERIELKNITTAKIQPKSLSPIRIGGGKLQPKMIDFAYVLLPTDITEGGYQNLELPADAPSESYNHTCQNTVLNKPIVISIETKAGTASADDSLPQLTIWAHAQFTKLEQLMRQSRPPPNDETDTPAFTLPRLLLATAHGPWWYFLIASRDEEGKQRLFRFPNAISTSRKVGVFQAVAALQFMLHQTVQTYQPWFEQHCVPLLPQQRINFGLDS